MLEEKWKKGIHGFISCRDFGVPLMFDLARALEARGIETRHWEALDKKSTRGHPTKAGDAIRTSTFSIIIVDGTGVDRSKPGRPAFWSELKAIRERLDAAEKHDTPYYCHVILAHDERGEPSFSDVQLPEEFSWLKVNEVGERMKRSGDIFDFEQAKAVAAAVDHWLADHRKELLALKAQGGTCGIVTPPLPPFPSPPPEGHFDFDALERDYLHRSIDGWLVGRVGAYEDARKKAPRRAGLAEAFQFRPERFVEFHATESVPGAESKREALSHWLFRPQLHPLLLVGEGGAGKTTALTAAACGFAGVRDEKLAKRAGGIAGEWLETAKAGLSGLPLYVPVVMRCADLCEAVAHAPGSPEALLDAVLAHMRHTADATARTELTDADRKAFRARLRGHAYVLMLDGLDEAPSPGAAEKLFEAARQLASDYDHNASALRVIATTRPDHGLDIRATEIDLKPPLLEWDRIEEFVKRFSAGDSALARLILDRAAKVWGAGDARNVALKTPLMLNAFCCIVREKIETDDYKFTFCRELIDYFLRGRAFDEATRLKFNAAADTTQIIRGILRRFAYEMITNGVAQLSEKQVEQFLRANADDLGLVVLDAKSASALLREIALQTTLLRRIGAVYGFGNVGILAEFLAAELMNETQEAPAASFLESRPVLLSRPAWRGAAQFKNALRREKWGSHHEKAFEEPAALLRAVTAESDAEFAWLACRTALEMVAENPPEPSVAGDDAAEMLSFAAQARDVYEQRFEEWDAPRRAAIIDLYFQCARRKLPEATRRSVGTLRAILLRDEKPWIAIVLADGSTVEIAPTPVLAAEYRCFLESPRHMKNEYWPYARSAADRVTINDPGSAGAEGRRDTWIAQMERPGAPVVSISWIEAIAFCAWLTDYWREAGVLKSYQAVRLPREVEWEAVMASVSGGKRFPWGEDVLEENSARVNWCKAGIDRPSAPGVFRATGPAGLYDLGSNVMTWIDLNEGHVMGRETPGEVKRGGGSWASLAVERLSARAFCRGALPINRFVDCGIRLVRTTGE